MMQPGGVAPPPMAPMSMDQQQYHQQQQQWMMQQQQQQQAPPQAQPQAPQMWGQPPMSAPPQSQGQQYGMSSPSDAAASGEARSLWIGDLQYWMDENFLSNCFYPTGELVSVKVIRNKQTLQSEGYGFLEFRSHAAAENILQTYNGTSIPNMEQQRFRMNWATLGAGEKRTDDPNDFTIFVGDLAADVTDYQLTETFKAVYQSVKGAKVVTDRTTGRSKGYGFVRFADESEQVRAMTEMNGVLCSTRPMRIGPAANKKPATIVQPYQKAPSQTPQGSQGESDPNNTTIFVGGLDTSVTDDHLRQVFGQYGELVHVKIPVGKRCGFVQFTNRANAEQALASLNGSQLGGQSIRLSWGRSPSNKQSEQPQWNGGAAAAAAAAGGAYGYGYQQGGYEAYGYAPPAQDPNVYYGGYPGYPNYQQAQQQ